MFVFMCGCICVLCVCCVVYAPHTCESQSRIPAVFLYHLPPYLLGTGFFPELEVKLFQWGWLVWKLLECSVSVPPCSVPGRQNHAVGARFYTQVLVLTHRISPQSHLVFCHNHFNVFFNVIVDSFFFKIRKPF